MKKLSAFILISFVTLSCSMGWEYPKEIFPEALFEWKDLKHPNIEFYIVRISTMKEVQKYRRNRQDFEGKVTSVCLGPYMSYNEQFPTTEFKFTGGDAQGDRYEVTLDADVFPKAQKKTVIFSGSAIEVWKNDEFMVGMRTPNESQ